MKPSISNYQYEKELGKGSYGSVIKAVRNFDGKTVAIKIIDVPVGNEKAFLNIQRESDFLEQLSEPSCSPFVVCYENSWYDPPTRKFYIEMEYVEGKDAKNFMKELRSKNSISMVYYYLLLIAKDVTQGLKFIHEKGIIHGDIKDTNILITKEYQPKIVDFGLSCLTEMRVDIGQYCNNRSGTPLYYAPETIKSGIKTFGSDMWALGIALYILATSNGYPFNILGGTTAGELFKMIVNKPITKLETVNEQLNTLVNNLLNKNLEERWTETKVLEHLAVIEKPPGVAKIPKI